MKRFEITMKRRLNDNMTWMSIYAPLVARKAKPGQFLILIVDEQGERIPLTMAGHDSEKGTVDIIFAAVGLSTMLLNTKKEGECLADVVGPLGVPTVMEGLKKVAVVGGGTGNALAYPIAIGMHDYGIHVDMISGFKSKDFVILEDEFRAGTDNLYVVTDDGSYGEKMFTTQKLEQLIDSGEVYDEIFTVGPPIMMKLVTEIAVKNNITPIVSLAPYMIDGTGMCGGCRAIIDGEPHFVCCDGPDFDGSKVDWDNLIERSAYYSDKEKYAVQHFCKLTGGVRYYG
ncbi:MAG: sulfide/dihydroorotate dehydrogenase-like FAD/NAD-binding protein [Anaerovoracaceae bacterium]